MSDRLRAAFRTNETQTTYYVAFEFRRWENSETDVGLRLAAKMSDATVGYLPVFETREEAEANSNDGAQIHTIRFAEEASE